VAEQRGAPCIYVLAGTNGAGKSSIGGASFRHHGADYFNPDEVARRIRATRPELGQDEANATAWREGARLLERAIRQRCDLAFETTLGGNTIARLLREAIAAGIEVRVWYTGLVSPELHIARVRARVAAGGHDIPEDVIRKRYDASRLNLISLLPDLAELRVYDNSAEADPASGKPPRPALLLHTAAGAIVSCCDLRAAPGWIKPILAAALKADASLVR